LENLEQVLLCLEVLLNYDLDTGVLLDLGLEDLVLDHDLEGRLQLVQEVVVLLLLLPGNQGLLEVLQDGLLELLRQFQCYDD